MTTIWVEMDRSAKQHAADNAMGHTWEKDEDGEIDTFAYASGYHNGPRCITCGYVYCVFCTSPIEPCNEPEAA